MSRQSLALLPLSVLGFHKPCCLFLIRLDRICGRVRQVRQLSTEAPESPSRPRDPTCLNCPRPRRSQMAHGWALSLDSIPCLSSNICCKSAACGSPGPVASFGVGHGANDGYIAATSYCVCVKNPTAPRIGVPRQPGWLRRVLFNADVRKLRLRQFGHPSLRLFSGNQHADASPSSCRKLRNGSRPFAPRCIEDLPERPQI